MCVCFESCWHIGGVFTGLGKIYSPRGLAMRWRRSRVRSRKKDFCMQPTADLAPTTLDSISRRRVAVLSMSAFLSLPTRMDKWCVFLCIVG